ncbi:hypothetical protein ACHAXR_010964 [Thalassiosira sp. AJA248-18]
MPFSLSPGKIAGSPSSSSPSLSDQKECLNEHNGYHRAINSQESSHFSPRRWIIAVASIATMGVSVRHHLNSAAKQSFQLQLKTHSHREESTHHTQPEQSEDAQKHRRLFSLANFMDPSSIELRKPFGVSDIHATSNQGNEIRRHSTNSELPNLSPYNLQNIKITLPAFNRELFILYYDPDEDEFQVYIDEKKDKYMSKEFSPVWGRLNMIVPVLTYALRTHFSERFQGTAGGSMEFIALFSSADSPKLTCGVREYERLKRPNFCQPDRFAPILQFGSVFKDTTILPNTVTMPVWAHLPCFKEWQMIGSICKDLWLRRDVAGVLGGEEALVADASAGPSMPFSVWDALTPTIIWRGSDFFFLNCNHGMSAHPLEWSRDVAPRLKHFGDHARGVMQSLLDLQKDVTPRWKGVIMTAMSELSAEEIKKAEREEMEESEGDDSHFQQHYHLWMDAKFTVKSRMYGKLVKPNLDKYEHFQQYGIQVTSEPMTLAQLSQYKYHIDFGGGGGTSWMGTIEKLAMPGVLFHHVTLTKDYYHDDLLPWVHYIPVREDLSDLRKMYNWAESNAEDARKISEAGTDYIKNLAKPEVMNARYEQYFVHSLKRVVDAYQPTAETEGKKMKDWLSKWKWSLVGKCSGRDEQWTRTSNVDTQCEMKDWREK